ncbi:hypothetical protein TCAL_00735 [Tigriopus californicus]|uniref:Phytanoyl-CoA dioxygenase n=1 Tax=Tigriopus californicus TaxID=6832 RepID=A0A553PAQ5_TIGCA|nr:probable phytanoyl-CoA dioxygenase [Tigriopus californicus]TRY74759.1 hypothetical protein TCAL_00735 [Tigriopus californicus]
MASSIREVFRREGFITPIRVLSGVEAQRAFQGFENYRIKYGVNGVLQGDLRFRVHLLAGWAQEIVQHPVLVDHVQKALGSTDIVCWSTDLNIKPAQSQSYFSWHQDSTYAGLEPADQVLTAWVALTPSKAESGCVTFLPRTHFQQYEHEEMASTHNLLAFGQRIKDKDLIEECKERQVLAELNPGNASLHSFRCIHGGGPNASVQDRVGLAIRYMTSRVSKIEAVAKERVTFVSGMSSSDSSNFDLEPNLNHLPDYDPVRWEQHQISMSLERQNYFKGTEETNCFK